VPAQPEKLTALSKRLTGADATGDDILDKIEKVMLKNREYYSLYINKANGSDR